MNFGEYFRGKRVTVMGLGLLGRGVGDAAYIAEAGAVEVLVTDLKTKDQLAESVAQLEKYSNVTFVLGEHREEDFKNRDFILVAAGVPIDSPYLKVAKEAGVPLKQSAALFAELTDVPIIGVTGTRGKSTVTHMIHHVLSEATGEDVLLGGNVRGVSNLQLLKEVKEDSLCVMELDSWQLQGFGWMKRSPQVAVFTNFMTDHMNYYKGDMNKYFEDKANIFKYQEESSVFITTPEVFEQAKKFEGVTVGQEVVLVDASLIGDDVLLSMPGEHNRLNAAITYEALKALSLDDETIFSGLASFKGVPGRLEYLGERDGVKIYNDNNATTPQATIVGLQAVGNSTDKNVILIAGGAYKDVDATPLSVAINMYCKKLVLLPGTGTDRLLDTLAGSSSKINFDHILGPHQSLEEAVAAAISAAESGDVILFSPAFASFGLFKNEYERNDAFVACINATSDML